MRSRVLTVAVLVLAAGLAAAVDTAVPPAAHARGSVSIANATDGGAAIDPTYATELRVSGSGFQSIKGGHGGVYVFFGTVSGNWRPSQGGVSGRDYVYVPDSETRNNQGYQAYLAFPGSDTAGSAQGRLSAGGRWSTTINVPGATFQAVGRNGGTRTVDCRKTTCGIITIGAHGVTNASNETFTPVRVESLYDAPPADSSDDGMPDDGAAAAPEADDAEAGTADPLPGADEQPANGKRAKPRLEVDRASAVAGHALSFSAQGLPPRAQVSAILDDGVAAAGPFLVGDDGAATGVVSLPTDLPAGTHELRLYGLPEGTEAPTVRFAVAAAETEAEVTSAVEPERSGGTDWPAVAFVVLAAVLLLLALLRLLLLRRRPAHA